jgi:hypothetical protein
LDSNGLNDNDGQKWVAAYGTEELALLYRKSMCGTFPARKVIISFEMRPRKRQGRTIKTEGQRCSGITSSDSTEKMFEMRPINYGLEYIEILAIIAWNSASKWPP